MRAAVLHAPGPASVLRVEDVPIPRPGPHEVLVKVRAVGVSYRDVVERNGTYRRDVVLPAILGLEIAGVIEALGELVEDLAVGDRVCTKAFSSCGRCRLCRNGRETTCASRVPVRGGYAQYVALPSDTLAVFPETLSFEVACSLGPCAGVALNAVRDVAKVRLGDIVLVSGASGGVGWPSMEIARASGATVIALTRSKEKRDVLFEGGAHHVVLDDEGNFAENVRALTEGNGVDVVIDNVGSSVFVGCYDSLGVHGRYALVGQLSGEHISINPARIFFKRAQLLGVGSVSHSQLEDAISLAVTGVIKPRVARVLGLEEIALAHELVEAGSEVGRVVVRPNED